MTKEGRHNWGNSQSIFRENFESEYNTVHNLGGKVTDVTYNADGTITNTVGYIDYSSMALPSAWTIKTKVNISNLAGNNAWFGNLFTVGNYTRLFTGITGTLILTNDADGSVSWSAGTIVVDTDYDVIITNDGTATSNICLYINGSLVGTAKTLTGTFIIRQLLAIGNNSIPFEGSMDFFETFDYAWSASQVANDYNKATHQALTDVSEQLGSDMASGWDFTNWENLFSSTTIDSNSFAGNHGAGIRKDLGLTIGSVYKTTITVDAVADTYVRYRNYATSGLYFNNTPVGTTTFYFTATDDGIALLNDQAGQTDISQLVIQEVLHPSITTLSNYTSRRGFSEDDYNTLTESNVTYPRQGSIYSAKFNKVNTLIDTGSDLIGTKNILAMGWIKPDSFGQSNFGVILSNGQFSLRIALAYAINQGFEFSNNNFSVNTRSSNNYAVVLNKWCFFAVYSTSTTAQIYVGYVNEPPALQQGLAQPIGTRNGIGTSNVLYGDNPASTNAFDGSNPDIFIGEVVTYVESELLKYITQYWSKTREKLS